jgi:Zn ribbon nucleic-acid-binding protein
MADFNHIHFKPGFRYGTPRQDYGHNLEERDTIFWDQAHFQPWVNEELNNVECSVQCSHAMIAKMKLLNEALACSRYKVANPNLDINFHK